MFQTRILLRMQLFLTFVVIPHEILSDEKVRVIEFQIILIEMAITKILGTDISKVTQLVDPNCNECVIFNRDILYKLTNVTIFTNGTNTQKQLYPASESYPVFI